MLIIICAENSFQVLFSGKNENFVQTTTTQMYLCSMKTLKLSDPSCWVFSLRCWRPGWVKVSSGGIGDSDRGLSLISCCAVANEAGFSGRTPEDGAFSRESCDYSDKLRSGSGIAETATQITACLPQGPHWMKVFTCKDKFRGQGGYLRLFGWLEQAGNFAEHCRLWRSLPGIVLSVLRLPLHTVQIVSPLPSSFHCVMKLFRATFSGTDFAEKKQIKQKIHEAERNALSGMKPFLFLASVSHFFAWRRAAPQWEQSFTPSCCLVSLRRSKRRKGI